MIHEPFHLSYYNSVCPRNERYIDEFPYKPEHEFDAILQSILAERGKPLWFMKGMAYHVTERITAEFARLFRNTFLIRDPRDAIPSHYKLRPDMTEEEAGYVDLKRMFDVSMNDCHERPVVVDADDFRKRPNKTMALYCEALGIPHKPEAMQWDQREIDIWKISEMWHRDATASTHILPSPPGREHVELPARLTEIIERSLEFYREMYRHRIVAPA